MNFLPPIDFHIVALTVNYKKSVLLTVGNTIRKDNLRKILANMTFHMVAPTVDHQTLCVDHCKEKHIKSHPYGRQSGAMLLLLQCFSPDGIPYHNAYSVPATPFCFVHCKLYHREVNRRRKIQAQFSTTNSLSNFSLQLSSIL